MIMGYRAREINIILRQIEIESEKYNLKLNKSKCYYVGMNGKANIHFKDGTKIEKADQVTYLGGTITATASREAEISSRMTKALATCQKLKIFWRKTNASIAWKIQVYNAVIISQLVYGLNTLNITPAIKARLDAFHMRGLRYILNIDHSYYSHVTNEEVINKMNLALNEADVTMSWEQFRMDKELNNEHYKSTKLVGDIILDRQMTLLGHVLRLPTSHIMRQVSCNENLRRPHQIYKRTGYPRYNWVTDNLQRAHTLFTDNEGQFDDKNPAHVNDILSAATNRKF